MALLLIISVLLVPLRKTSPTARYPATSVDHPADAGRKGYVFQHLLWIMLITWVYSYWCISQDIINKCRKGQGRKKQPNIKNGGCY